jgi:hypothetical protein
MLSGQSKQVTEFGTLRKGIKMVDIKQAIQQTYIINAEHENCERRCLGDRQLDIEQHSNYVAHIIAYYMLGLSNG